MISSTDEDQCRKKRKVSFCTDNTNVSTSSCLRSCEKQEGKQDELRDVYKNRHQIFAFFSSNKKANNANNVNHETEGKCSNHGSIIRNNASMITGYSKCCMINVEDIQSWKHNEGFVSPIECSRSRNKECQICLERMFSRQIRGKPIADLEWFQDQQLDHVTSSRYRNIYSKIAYKYFFMLTKKELSLREISRKDVLDALLLRFRGFYNPLKPYTIDVIIHKHEFSSIKNWCLWKHDLDRKFLMEYNSIRNNRLFCSGCGDKCITFQGKQNHTMYQKCSNNLCDFFYKEGSFFATVKKDPNKWS